MFALRVYNVRISPHVPSHAACRLGLLSLVACHDERWPVLTSLAESPDETMGDTQGIAQSIAQVCRDTAGSALTGRVDGIVLRLTAMTRRQEQQAVERTSRPA